MTKKTETGGPVIIKKYANRRLYDTSTSSYVTLDHLSDLVRREIDFQVVDAKTGEDLTRQVLTQIIFEQETKGEGALPITFLRKLIGFYGGGSQKFLPAWLEMSMNSFSEAQDRWTKRVGGTANPFAMFENQARANIEMFEKTMRMFKPDLAADKAEQAEAEAEKAEPKAKAKTAKAEKAAKSEAELPMDPVSILRSQMEMMQAQLDALSGKN